MTAAYRIPARIETERLVIRRYVVQDAEALSEVAARNKDHLLRYMEWAQHEPQTPEQRRAFIAAVNEHFDTGADYTMGFFDRRTGALLGGTGFHRKVDPERLEIGYWIDGLREGDGLVTETASALTWVALAYAGARLVSIAHAASNVRSAAVPARLGFARQPSPASYRCYDGGHTVAPVDWHADPAVLEAEPLASFTRPTLFDDAGAMLAWPSAH